MSGRAVGLGWVEEDLSGAKSMKYEGEGVELGTSSAHDRRWCLEGEGWCERRK